MDSMKLNHVTLLPTQTMTVAQDYLAADSGSLQAVRKALTCVLTKVGEISW